MKRIIAMIGILFAVAMASFAKTTKYVMPSGKTFALETYGFPASIDSKVDAEVYYNTMISGSIFSTEEANKLSDATAKVTRMPEGVYFELYIDSDYMRKEVYAVKSHAVDCFLFANIFNCFYSVLSNRLSYEEYSSFFHEKPMSCILIGEGKRGSFELSFVASRNTFVERGNEITCYVKDWEIEGYIKRGVYSFGNADDTSAYIYWLFGDGVALEKGCFIPDELKKDIAAFKAQAEKDYPIMDEMYEKYRKEKEFCRTWDSWDSLKKNMTDFYGKENAEKFMEKYKDDILEALAN